MSTPVVQPANIPARACSLPRPVGLPVPLAHGRVTSAGPAQEGGALDRALLFRGDGDGGLFLHGRCPPPLHAMFGGGVRTTIWKKGQRRAARFNACAKQLGEVAALRAGKK